MKTDQCSVITKQKVYLIITAFVLSVFISNRTYGQDSAFEASSDDSGGSSSGFIWGGKAGGSLNQLNQPGTLIGATAGLVGSFEVADFFIVQAELLYTMNGGGRADATRQLAGEVLSVTYLNRSVVMQSVEIPVMLFFTLSELNTGTIVPRLGIGASYAYCFSAFEYHDKIFTLSNGTQALQGNRSENILADIEPHQFSFKVGLAIDYKLESGKILGTEMRYSHGLNDVNLTKTTYTGFAQFPTSLSFTLSLKF